MSRQPAYPAAARTPATADQPAAAQSRLGRAGARLTTFPVWVQALLVYLTTRILTFTIFAVVARTQEDTPWGPGHPAALRDFLNFWDSGWYERIATGGYPTTLPLTPEGTVGQNEWAFYPLHPLLVSAVTALTGLDYRTVAPSLSTLAAGLAAIVLLVLFRDLTTPGRALTGLVLVFVFPATPILNTGYAESLTLLLLALALLLVVRGHYYLAIPVVVLLDLSRPIGVAFSFFMLIHLIDRFRRRSIVPYPPREVAASWVLGVTSCVAALLHPALAWLRTGSLTAYTDTEAAWSGGHTRVLVQWIDTPAALLGPAGPVLVVLFLGLVLWLVLGPLGARTGRTLQHFGLAYLAYLLLFFTPQTSTVRLLIPLFAPALALAHLRSGPARVVLVLGSVLLQIIWVAGLWHFRPPADLPP